MYTVSETAKAKELYADGVAIAAIATVLGKSEKSIIGKLSREEVYVPKVKVSKVTGDKPKTKQMYVTEIENILEVKLEGLEKAPKNTLVAMLTAVTEWLGEPEVDEQDHGTVEGEGDGGV